MRGLKIRRKLLAVVVLAALLTALGGCGGGGPAADGLLSSGNGIHAPIPRGGNCVPPGHAQTFGDQVFTNYGKTAVTLDHVVLLRPHHERLIGSYAVPGQLLIGVVFWPPKYPGTPAVPGVPSAWKHRQPVHGFRLAPGRSFNMVLGVVATAPVRASSQGMLVYYHDSSGSYVARNYFAMIIAKTKFGC